MRPVAQRLRVVARGGDHATVPRLPIPYQRDTLPDLHHDVVRSLLLIEAENAWMQTFVLHRYYYSTRQAFDGPPARAPRYFESIDEVAETDDIVLNKLRLAYQAISVEHTEGKDSPGTPGSSPSSEPSEPEATEPQSGLQVAAL